MKKLTIKLKKDFSDCGGPDSHPRMASNARRNRGYKGTTPIYVNPVVAYPTAYLPTNAFAGNTITDMRLEWPNGNESRSKHYERYAREYWGDDYDYRCLWRA